MLKYLAMILAAATLAACATAPNPLGPEARGGIYVRDVAVSWSVNDGKRAEKAGYQTHKKDMSERLQTVLAQKFKNSPSGSEPVTFRVDVTKYSEAFMVRADVSVVRASDGKVLGVYKNVTGVHASNGGLLGALIEAAMKPDYVGILSNAFAADLRTRFDHA